MLDQLQPGAVLFSSLVDRDHRPAQRSQTTQFLLDILQPLMPLPVRNLVCRPIPRLPPVLLVQLVDFRDLGPQTPNFSLEDF